MTEIKNAVIKSVSISNEDHGVLSIWLNLDYGGSGQGFGGYALWNPNWEKDATGKFIWRVMEIVGVNRWEDITGQSIRVKTEHTGIQAIGHFLEDKWFNPSKELKDD